MSQNKNNNQVSLFQANKQDKICYKALLKTLEKQYSKLILSLKFPIGHFKFLTDGLFWEPWSACEDQRVLVDKVWQY